MCAVSAARALLVALVLAGLVPARAAAHAPPQIIDIVDRKDAGPIYVSNRGLILGDSPEGPFRLLCTEATKTNTSERPDVIALPNGDLVLATSRGLIRSHDGGCSFEPLEPLGDLLVPAAAADPEDSTHFWVAAFDVERGGLFETRDGGDSFETLQPADENHFVATILISPAKPERLYLDGQQLADGSKTFYVAMSDDGGRTFDQFDLQLDETEDAFELLAVSPVDPDLLMARAADGDPVALQDRLLVSHDHGQTWSSPITVHALTEARFSADGASAWVAGVDGAFRSDDGLMSFEPIAGALRISLPTEHDGELWLCGYYDGMHDGIGRVAADGSVEGVFSFKDVMEPAACPASSPSAVACETLWRDWQREQFGIVPDAGTPMPPSMPSAGAGASADAGPDGSAAPRPDAGSAPRTKHEGGCSAGHAPSGSALSNTEPALAALWVLARASRRRQRGFSRD